MTGFSWDFDKSENVCPRQTILEMQVVFFIFSLSVSHPGQLVTRMFSCVERWELKCVNIRVTGGVGQGSWLVLAGWVRYCLKTFSAMVC